MRNYTYYTQSKQYHAYNAKPTGLSNGATPPMSVLPNAWLHLPLSKLLGLFLRHILAKKARTHAWPQL
jgi:hypothetical protein